MARKKHVNEVVFTVAELSARWKVDRHTIVKAIRDQSLKAFRVSETGGQYRILATEVERYEQQHMPKPAVAS